eukprot:1702370-Karenia_brevis.AAC.1
MKQHGRGVVRPRGQPIWMTRAWLVGLLQDFYETLNVRETRRRQVAHYMSNALAFTLNMRACQLLEAVPPARVVSSMIASALGFFLDSCVKKLAGMQYIYNGQAIR